MKINYFGGFCSILVVGLGQITKGETNKGVLLLLLFYFVLPSVIYLALMLNGHIFLVVLGLALILGIILWVYSFVDACVKNEEVV